MYYRLFLVSALLSGLTGESSVHGSPERAHGPKQVLAFAGEEVILPCAFNVTASSDFPTVEWSKEDLEPDVIFLYRDGCETYEMKHPEFEYRTSFIMKELKNGDISLRITNVRLSDAGKYQCMRLWKNAPRDITTVELVVGAVSEPKLSVVSTESGGVTLQCEASCWLPEPEIKFLDDHDDEIPAEDPKRNPNASGCHNVTRRVTLQTATSRVTCRVHQLDYNQTRVTEINIPADCMRSFTVIIVIAVGGTILFVLACGLVFLLWKKCGKSAKVQKLPVTRQESDSTVGGTSENRLLLDPRGADSVDNSAVEHLNKKIAELESQLREKDETIRQLQNRPQLSPVVYYYNQPTVVCSPSRPLQTSILTNDHNSTPTVPRNSNPPKSANLPQNKCPKPGTQRQNSNPGLSRPIQKPRRNNSSPALFSCNATELSSSSSGSTSERKQGRFRRSMSESGAQPDPNLAKLQRRYSLAFHNRYGLLAELKEESDTDS
ncbi:butyrophilin subfamily 3 member A2 isoform X1 [Lates calcarifer]|uniref:Butyrophilin subfamily 3 member A2 isoform X1 n=2 Tax=Lates calcarifer TaxID=8187 RepID=A0AAJ7QL47_LATCA|nr:butyrophilin subfamily 3 member A2 isoform X1 [Lates calcarifer]